ncbi:S-adenosyl-L-methionine-dependent methyltransferase [Hyaloraphidium curvatum]|nr:S-adenosyl-L-methionine-dependent methyltransferase [Hyaloraphidium curvatum]
MPMYKRGWAVGMDAASGLCVRALDIAADDRVLDLCCAPGIKLCAIADELEVRAGVGSVTGVDVSEKRLVVCRSQVRKMGVTRCRLFCADGTAFGVPPPFLDWTLCPDGARSSGTPAAAKRKPFYASRLLASPLCDAGSPRLYNKVLVDADCTTEGSLNHVRKMAQWTKEHGGDGELLAGRPFAAEDLPELQFALLENSFRMCEPGGVIVYSTCSLTRQQNEEVVARFLEAHGNEAELDELPFDRTTPKSWRSFAAQYPAAMNMDRTWRFDPSTQTSGLFIARFRRR